MITVSFRFARSFKIMHVPQPIIPFRAPSQPFQVIRSGRGGEINFPYISAVSMVGCPRLINFGLMLRMEFVRFICMLELKLFLISGKILFTPTSSMYDDSRFVSWVVRDVNESVKFMDVAHTTQHVQSRVASWTKNIFVHSWGLYPSMIPPYITTITRRAYNLPVTFHRLVLRSNHDCLRLKCI